MTTKTATALVLVMVTAGCSKLGIGGASPKNDDEQTPYALGMMIGRSLGDFDLTPRELELVKAGLVRRGDQEEEADGAREVRHQGPGAAPDANDRALRGRKGARARRRPRPRRASSARFAPLRGWSSGATKPGTGAVTPQPTDKVKVHYVGRLLDGTEFDSSRKRGQPAEFPLNGVIPCWTEGVGKMKVGEVATLFCPSEIAYGDGGRPPTIPGGATLVFDVELLEIPGRRPARARRACRAAAPVTARRALAARAPLGFL